MRSGRAAIALLLGVTLSLLGLGNGASSAAQASDAAVMMRVLSHRADLVTDGDALIEVSVPSAAGQPRVDVAGRDVSGVFRRMQPGIWRGLVTGLRMGGNEVRATLPDGRGARLAVTNHSTGGPLIAGPQVQPWTCDVLANFNPPQGKQCSRTPRYTFKYKDSERGDYHAYDPASPPAPGSIAQTTTDQGVTVPFIVRMERGGQDRGNYIILVLFDPTKPFTATAPQRGWNHKLLIPFGPGSAAHHSSADPGEGQGGAALQDNELALSRGFMIALNSLNIHGLNLNDMVSAEALLMLKERIVEQYGPVRYTMSNGCSGGGIAQYMIPAMYPGLLDGIQPTCSFEDFWSTMTETLDCHLSVHYFNLVSPHLWPVQAQRNAVDGHAPAGCEVWDVGFAGLLDPAKAENCALPAEVVYNPQSNPKGVRCAAQDYMKAIWGPRPRAEWGPVERKIGLGFPQLPIDNVGVQYGLKAFQDGLITATQFVDLNAKIGGIDIDYQFVPRRMNVDAETLRTAYSAGQITDARQLADVAILDLRGYSEVGEVHTSYHSYAMRARLDQRNGHHENQVIWTSTPVPPILPVPQKELTDKALVALDSWLTAVEADHSDRSRAQKVAADKPTAVTDACFVHDVQLSTSSTCDGKLAPFDRHRGVAGAPATNDVIKCQLKPVQASDYKQALSADELATLKSVFPTGVCDWSRRGVGQQAARTWVTFNSGPGGTELGPAPVSRPLGGGARSPIASAASNSLPTTGGGVPYLALPLLVAAIMMMQARRLTSRS
jgi:hypothetical protein